MTTTEARDRADELDDVREQMMELLGVAERLVRGTPAEGRARAYWIGHIRSALGSDDYPTHASTMAEAVADLREEDAEPCPSCDGEGMQPPEEGGGSERVCTTCGGSGMDR